MTDSPSIARRAVLAVALMIGFYGLALGLAALLAWIPYAEWHYANRIDLRIAIFCVVGAFVIVKAIVPRPDRFQPPGPSLDAQKQPRLFAELTDIARATGQEMPAEVYLAPDVNAWVSQRGGLMGFGSRRVMAVGLPLLQVLSVSQLRAVLAHEFGHYHGGDVRVGPWIYKTRQALVRTLQGLSGHSKLLTKPFALYASLFFRLTHAVSRHQERLADALAARVAGAAALIGGLKAVHGAALAFNLYWQQEVSPVLSAGFLPPLADGFGRLLGQPKIAAQVREAVDEAARKGKSDPFDTHPSLQERIAALARAGGTAEATAPADDPPAISLLEHVERLERRLLTSLGGDKARGLRALHWEEVGVKVLVPQWEAFVGKHAAVLAGITPLSLLDLSWEVVGRKALKSLGRRSQEPLPAADYAVGAAVGLALARRGFTVDSPVGEAVSLVRDGVRVHPFSLRSRFASDPAERTAWPQICDTAEIAGLDLGSLISAPKP
jgi:Zn-dependent protease with chaperone function